MNGCIMQTQHELPNVYLSTEQGELQLATEGTFAFGASGLNPYGLNP